MNWYLYIARCADNSLYTGITKDLKRRVIEHNTDNLLASKYVRNKRPVTIVYYEEHETQSSAAKRESAIKSLTREYKLKLIAGFKSEIK